MKFRDECLELFGTHNLYEAFKIKNNASPDKTYYQMSILWHPDRFSKDDEDKQKLATRKFQLISRIYKILNDADKRAAYDDSGVTEEDEQEVDWYKFWKSHFKKVTAEEIDAYLEKFRGYYNFIKIFLGSRQEMEDVRNAYLKYKGNMNKILQAVIGADVSNEDRLREIIDYFIKNENLVEYDNFTKEPMSARVKRLNQARREAIKAAKYSEELKGKKASVNSEEDLFNAISSNSKRRAEEMIANLENKYCKVPAKKKKKK